MAKYTCYAVKRIDGETGIFNSWPEAQKFIAGCPSKAEYKGFCDKTSALAFLDKENKTASPTDGPANPSDFSDVQNGTLVAFVDGSYNEPIKTWGWAAVLFDPNDLAFTPVEINGKGTAHADARNITGEVYGAMMAVKTAVQLGYKRIAIYHDYQGISSWVTGEWKCKQDLTREYKTYMTKQMESIDISFVKVAGHTGVELNERADVLAKLGCGVAI